MEGIIADDLDDDEEEGEEEGKNEESKIEDKDDFIPSQPVLLSQKAVFMKEVMEKKKLQKSSNSSCDIDDMLGVTAGMSKKDKQASKAAAKEKKT